MKIIYRDLDSRWNCCDTENGIVFIDKNILNYPKAHEYVVEHELKHMRIGENLLGQIKHELRNDLFLHFSLSEEARQLREYIQEQGRESGVGEILKAWRSIWMLLILPLSFARRLLE